MRLINHEYRQREDGTWAKLFSYDNVNYILKKIIVRSQDGSLLRTEKLTNENQRLF